MPAEQQPLTELTTRDVLLQVDRRLTLIEDDLRTIKNGTSDSTPWTKKSTPEPTNCVKKCTPDLRNCAKK